MLIEMGIGYHTCEKVFALNNTHYNDINRYYLFYLCAMYFKR